MHLVSRILKAEELRIAQTGRMAPKAYQAEEGEGEKKPFYQRKNHKKQYKRVHRHSSKSDWVKNAECYNCGKKGHLRRDCEATSDEDEENTANAVVEERYFTFLARANTAQDVQTDTTPRPATMLTGQDHKIVEHENALKSQKALKAARNLSTQKRQKSQKAEKASQNLSKFLKTNHNQINQINYGSEERQSQKNSRQKGFRSSDVLLKNRSLYQLRYLPDDIDDMDEIYDGNGKKKPELAEADKTDKALPNKDEWMKSIIEEIEASMDNLTKSQEAEADKTDKAEKADKTDKAEKADKTNKTDKAKKATPSALGHLPDEFDGGKQKKISEARLAHLTKFQEEKGRNEEAHGRSGTSNTQNLDVTRYQLRHITVEEQEKTQVHHQNEQGPRAQQWRTRWPRQWPIQWLKPIRL